MNGGSVLNISKVMFDNRVYGRMEVIYIVYCACEKEYLQTVSCDRSGLRRVNTGPTYLDCSSVGGGVQIEGESAQLR